MTDTTMSCSDVRDKLPLHVSGDLESDVLALVGAHLDSCSECAREAAAVERAREVFRDSLLGETATPSESELWSGIRATLVTEGLVRNAGQNADDDHAARPRLRLLRRASGFAAAAAVLVAATVFGPQLVGDGPSGPAIVDSAPGAGAPLATVEDGTAGSNRDDASGLAPGEVMLEPTLGRPMFSDAWTLDLRAKQSSGPDGANALVSDVSSRGLPPLR